MSINYPNRPKRKYVKPNKSKEDESKVVKRKYNNEKVVVDDITFDSKKEMSIYLLLNNLKKANKIKSFEMQVQYVLQDSYKMLDETKKQGFRTERSIKYLADFVIVTNDSKEHVVDVKGFVTDKARIKKKLFEYKFNEPLHFVKSSSSLLKVLKI